MFPTQLGATLQSHPRWKCFPLARRLARAVDRAAARQHQAEHARLDTSCLISKRYALNDILEAYCAFETREDSCLKVVITLWEER